MPEPPTISVVDTHGPVRPADLLGGPERPAWQVPQRARVAGRVVLLLVVGGVAAGAVAQQISERQARAEAFAIADKVHLRAQVQQVYGVPDGDPRALSADVDIVSSAAGPHGNRVTSVRFEGEGLTARDPELSASLEASAQVRPVSEIDCDQVGSGRFPATVDVVVDVLARSGVTHSQRIPLPAPQVRQSLLEACLLPDPQAEPDVEVEAGADGTLLVFIQSVPRSRQPLVLEAVEVAGFDVRPSGAFTLPSTLPPGTGGLYGFSVGIADCAAATEPYEAVVRLQDGGASEARVADTAVSQPQPGGVPAVDLLRRLARESC